MIPDIATFEAAIARTADQGGGTFATDGTPFEPESGYAVGVGGIILDPATVGAYRLRHAFKQVHKDFGGNYVGTWLDEGQLYVDAVVYLPAWLREDAFTVGRNHNQLAIYDFAAGESITLGSGGLT